jgi:hypothetical protein
MRFIPLMLLAIAQAAHASSVLYSMGPDLGGSPGNGFTAISTTSGSGTPVALNSTYSYNGGLTYDSATGNFFAIANDGLGNSTLQSFLLAAPSPPSVAATATGVGFLNGLGYDSSDGNLYAVSNDGAGNGELNRVATNGAVTPTLALSGLTVGLFDGGLTIDSSNGLFYFLSDDGSGSSRVFSSIELSGGVVTADIFMLGDGTVSFNGGLLYDPASGLFYTIGNDQSGNSSLYSFSLSGASSLSTVLADFGSGYNNVGLAEIPPTGVPEATTVVLFATSIIALAALKRRKQ